MRLYRSRLHQGSRVMYAFPRRIDAWLEDVDVTSDRPQVYFSRYECASDDADIYRVTGDA